MDSQPHHLRFHQQTTTNPQPPAPVQADANHHPFLPQISDADATNQFLSSHNLIGHANTATSLPVADPSMMMAMTLANGQLPQQAQAKAISPDEIALYDRQIRLWGMAAQAKIQSANILLITMRALANEVAKNLVLAGVGSLTILDSSPVTEPDLGAQFLQTHDSDSGRSHIGLNRAETAAPALRKLNPRVRVVVDADGVKSKGPSYFSAFDIVIATDLDPDSFNLINTATRINGKAFYAAGTHGMFGFIFSDLIEHDYVIERDASNVVAQPGRETRTRSILDVQTKKDGNGRMTESVTKRELYSTWFLASDVATLPAEYTSSKRRLRTVSPALSCLRALWAFMQMQNNSRLPGTREDLKLFTQLATQKHKALSLPSETLRPEFLRTFLQNLGSEIAPVAAILGGQLAQDVINVLGHKQQPIQNTVIFDGNKMEALVYPLHPEGNLGATLLSTGGVSEGLVDNEMHGGVGGVMPAMPVMENGVGMMNGIPMVPNGSNAGIGIDMSGAGQPLQPNLLQQQQQQQVVDLESSTTAIGQDEAEQPPLS